MWITLIAMTVSSAMILVDQTPVPLAIPHTMENLNSDPSLGSWIITANMLPLAAFKVLGQKVRLHRTGQGLHPSFPLGQLNHRSNPGHHQASRTRPAEQGREMHIFCSSLPLTMPRR